MTDQQQVYVIRGSSRWHANIQCTVLDTAALTYGGPVLTVTAGTTTHTPCLVCASDPTITEWMLTPVNLPELWELIEPSKPHYVAMSGRTEVDGLTIWAHKGMPQQVARFGDTIRLDRGGCYTVHAAGPQPPATSQLQKCGSTPDNPRCTVSKNAVCEQHG